MTRILLVEDQLTLAESVSRYLTNEGYHVTVATSVVSARPRLADRPDLMIIDWMLPDGHGLDLLKEVRRADERTPVIILTARTDLVDKVLGLESGANDYMTKPFEPRELIARIRAQLRAQASKLPNDPEVTARLTTRAGITIDEISRQVTFRGDDVLLTRMEYELLRVLVQSPNRVFPRETLLNKVWGYDSYPTTRTVDNHIVQLRSKFGAELFETVRGIGYRFRDVENE